MRKFMIIIFTILLGMINISHADQSFVRKSESSISESAGKEGVIKTVVNSTFAVDTIYNPINKKFLDVLISQKLTSIFIPGRESADSTVEVVAWISGKNRYDTKLWAIKAGADEGGKWGDFYRTINYGCCGAETAYNAFDFKTGKHAFSYTAEPVFVDIPNTPIKRNISYVSSNAISDYIYAKQYPRGVGVLTISADGTVIDQVIFETDDKELAWSPKLSLTDANEPKGVSSLSLWHADGIGKADLVKAFSVKLFFYDGMEIIVPVNSDRFDLKKSALPKAVTIRRISVVQSNRK